MDSKPAKPVDGFAAFSVERLASLSDGVFAVAMTLLAYNIHIPIGPLNEAGLRGALARMVPAVMALVLSFFAAVMFWMGHQRLLGMMRQSGRIIYPPSFILLLLIILLPITTNLYGTFGATPSIALLYSVNLAGIALAQLFLSFWLVREEVPAQMSRRQVLAVPIYVSGVFVAAAITSIFSPWASQFIWFGAFAAPLIQRMTSA